VTASVDAGTYASVVSVSRATAEIVAGAEAFAMDVGQVNVMTTAGDSLFG
jgi:hypothetical protein